MTGNPAPEHVSTSSVARQNPTMRLFTRRFTRLAKVSSKELDNHAHAVAPHFPCRNFARIRKTLRASPAMEAGVDRHAWALREMADLPGRVARAAAA